jgi:predicted nucleic acid-binding protein
MIVVSDASPMNVLIRIDHVYVLPQLYKTVIVPPTVIAELSHISTPVVIRSWLSTKPIWLEIKKPLHIDPSLKSEDDGEAEAISLALELRADLLLADDWKARRAARKRGIEITGVLGVLELASAQNLIEFPTAIQRLRATDFYISDDIVQKALERDAQRKQT